MNHEDLRRQEILDGKRSWNKDADAGGDADVFYTEVVLALRQLRDRGMFELLHEHRGKYNGRDVVDIASIGGSINLEK